MNETTSKLRQCFITVFPDLPEDKIPSATQDNTPAWDSVASITLVNLIEDEFGITVDLERIGELASAALSRLH